MHSAVSHTFQYGIQPGSTQNSGTFSLIGIVSFAVNLRKQLVRNDGSRQFVAVHHSGRAIREYVNIADKRDIEAVLPHKQQHLMKLAGIIAELCNNELSAGGDFLFKLEILRHLFRFGRLERRNDRAGEKVACLMTNNPFDSRIL